MAAQETAGRSSSTADQTVPCLSPRQQQKSRAVNLQDVDIDPARVDHDLSLLISQYLHTRPFSNVTQLFDEQVLGVGRGKQHIENVEEVERAILDGQFGSLDSLVSRPGLLKPQSQKAFMYLAYREQFLEYIDNRETQKAFSILQKRLKPLEHYQPVPYDFFNLCYLTSAGTVHDAPGLKDWAGAGPERERLVGMWRELTDAWSGGDDVIQQRETVPRGRLLGLLKQAAAWQVGNAPRRGMRPWTVKSLLQDYAVRSVPDHLRFLAVGHKANVKCADFIGDEPRYIVSGSSDSTLRVFSLQDKSTRHVLSGHRSRVWDCSASCSSGLIASASGDGTVRLWSAETGACERVLDQDSGDVYSVRWRPAHPGQVATASYDRMLRSWDVETGSLIHTYSGHSQSTLAVAYDHTGNVIASGSKDRHVRLWDAIGGMCVKTLPGSLGEIASVEFDGDGKYLLAGCKDNSNRLWDLRMQRILYRYTGHQNTSKNLIRCCFGGYDSSLVIGGSEDGKVYIWDREAPLSASKTKPASPASPASPWVAGSPLLSIPQVRQHGLTPSSTLPVQDRSSPAYYPPKPIRPLATPPQAGGGANVRPIKVLEGHGDGAVFDVRWKNGEVASAGEDGRVGVWDTLEEDTLDEATDG